MTPVTYIAFKDELEKISAALNVPQMLAQEGKGLKRGVGRCPDAEEHDAPGEPWGRERQAFYAGNKAQNVAEATNVARFRGPAQAAAQAPVNNTAAHAQTFVRPKPGPPTGKPSMMSRLGKPMAGLGAAAIGGAAMEHHHDQAQGM